MRDKLFPVVLRCAYKIESFGQMTEQEEEIARIAFSGLFDKKGERIRKSPEPWAGFVRDGVSIPEMREQCLRSAFCRLTRYHLGLESAYLGTIINSTMKLEIVAESYGLTREFANKLDTLSQVFVYLVKQGKTSSVAGDIWRKAICG